MKAMQLVPFLAMMASAASEQGMEVAKFVETDKESPEWALGELAQRSDPVIDLPGTATECPKMGHEMSDAEVCRLFAQCELFQSSDGCNYCECLNGEPQCTQHICPWLSMTTDTTQADGTQEDTGNNRTWSLISTPLAPATVANPSPLADNQASTTLDLTQVTSDRNAGARTNTRDEPGSKSFPEEMPVGETNPLRRRSSDTSPESKTQPEGEEEGEPDDIMSGSPTNPELPETGSGSGQEVKIHPEIGSPTPPQPGEGTISGEKPELGQDPMSPKLREEPDKVLYCKKLGTKWICKECSPKCPRERT